MSKITEEQLTELEALDAKIDTLVGDEYSQAIYRMVRSVPGLIADLREARKQLAADVVAANNRTRLVAENLAFERELHSKTDEKLHYMEGFLGDIIASLRIELAAYERDDGQPTELEMHRADYQACKAAGFESPGELLSAYKTLEKQLDAVNQIKATIIEDRMEWMFAAYELLEATGESLPPGELAETVSGRGVAVIQKLRKQLAEAQVKP